MIKIFRILRRKIKSYLIDSKLYLLFEPTTEFVLRWIYTIKFAKWYNEEVMGELHIITQGDIQYDNRYKLYQFLLEQENLKNRIIDYLEFGVYRGASLKWWVDNNKNPESRFFGFDTFHGLPESWGSNPRGTYSAHGRLPQIQDNRCYYEAGFFKDTLYKFLEKYALDRKMIVHLDADLYSSTLYVLTAINFKLKKGDIIIFDEFTDVIHEFRAFYEFKLAYNFRYKVLGSVNNGYQIAFMVI